jgi:hypothetical protein
MSDALKLIPAKHNLSDGSWSDDDYDVVLVETGKTVGRIFRQMVAPDNPNEWFWSLDFFQVMGARPFYGHAESKEAAKHAFAERWRSIPESAAQPGNSDS